MVKGDVVVCFDTSECCGVFVEECGGGVAGVVDAVVGGDAGDGECFGCDVC